MNRTFPLRWLARSLILLPYVAPVISVVFAWQFFFDPVNGIFYARTLVEQLGWMEQSASILISDPGNALWVAIVFNMWRNFPFQLPDDTQPAASHRRNPLRGGGDRRRQWLAEVQAFITLAEIYFVVGALILLRFIWNFNKFEEVFLLTGINVKTMPIYIYLKAFIGTMELGDRLCTGCGSVCHSGGHHPGLCEEGTQMVKKKHFFHEGRRFLWC
jgi:multiple sugar transport system permease protein